MFPINVSSVTTYFHGVCLIFPVKPSRVVLSGSKGEVMQNTPVELKCEVFEALPAATITWYVDNQLTDEKKFKVETKMVLAVSSLRIQLSSIEFT